MALSPCFFPSLQTPMSLQPTFQPLHGLSGPAATVKGTELVETVQISMKQQESSASSYAQHYPGAALGAPAPVTMQRESLLSEPLSPMKSRCPKSAKLYCFPHESMKECHEQGSRNLTQESSQAFKQNQEQIKKKIFHHHFMPRSPVNTMYPKSWE